jgi:hypothetical protein
MIKDKKGISAVVATVLLIFLAIVAVFVIAGIIIPFVSDSLDEGTECVDYKDYYEFYDDEIAFNCYRVEGTHTLYALTISADTVSEEVEEKIKGFRLAFTTVGSGDSEAIAVETNGSTWGNDEGFIRRINTTWPLEIPGSGEVRTYVYNTSKTHENVEIFPELVSGTLCEKTDSIKIAGSICDPSLILTLD